MARRNKAATVGVASVALAFVLGLGLAMAAWVRERVARERERYASRVAACRGDQPAPAEGHRRPTPLSARGVKNEYFWNPPLGGRRDFARARAQLKLALGDKPGHDRGSGYTCWVTYQAAMRQREAEALFQAKGIPLSEPDAK